jgi:integrase
MDGWTYADQKKASENLLARIADRTGELQRVELEKPGLPVKQAWATFLTSPRRPDSGPVTLKYYALQWNRFEGWMEKRKQNAAMRDVDADTAEAYAAFLTAGGAAPNTYNKHVALLQLVFRILGLTPAHKITGNPWANIQRRRLASHSHRELTVAELRQVCAAAEGEMKILFAIGIYTGLRLADAATLQWGEVDLDRGLIQRVPRKTARRTGKPVQVPVHRALAAMLAETPKDERSGPVLPDLCARYNADGYSVPRLIQAHFERCGIATHAPGTGIVKDKDGNDVNTGKRARVDVGFHSLRHTFVSLCRAANTPLSVVESIVGHSSPAMTRHYTHTGEAAARSAIAMLPGLKEKRTMPTPEERLKQLLAKVRRMPAAKVKRAVLRLLAGMRVKAKAG